MARQSTPGASPVAAGPAHAGFRQGSLAIDQAAIISFANNSHGRYRKQRDRNPAIGGGTANRRKPQQGQYRPGETSRQARRGRPPRCDDGRTPRHRGARKPEALANGSHRVGRDEGPHADPGGHARGQTVTATGMADALHHPRGDSCDLHIPERRRYRLSGPEADRGRRDLGCRTPQLTRVRGASATNCRIALERFGDQPHGTRRDEQGRERSLWPFCAKSRARRAGSIPVRHEDRTHRRGEGAARPIGTGHVIPRNHRNGSAAAAAGNCAT